MRGFAVKFNTDEGNWDLVGNNMPVFFIQDEFAADARLYEVLLIVGRNDDRDHDF